MKNIIRLALILFPTIVGAQTPCPAPLEKTAIEVRKLVEEAPQKYTNIDQFLDALPPMMKSNFIFMGESRSFQTATKENPRVILTSPNGDVRISFNTAEGQRGYNNVEISFYDPIKKEFEYRELDFDPEQKKAPTHHGDTACTTCHGTPPKPNWDTYNYWSGVIPFNKDTLVAGSVELGWYSALIAKTKDKSAANTSRLKYLTPIESAEDIQKAMKSPGYLMRKFLGENGPQVGNQGGIGTQLFDRLQERQRCAEAKNISKDPSFARVKYILAGIKSGCDINKFVPDWYHKAANDYFYGTLDGFAAPVAGENLSQVAMQKLVDDTDKKQIAIRKDKDNRQRSFVQKQLKSIEQANNEMQLSIDKIGLNVIGIRPGQFQENIGENSGELATLRYYLEPMGILASRLSTSIDPNTYSFADLFQNDYILPEDEAKIDEEIKAAKLGAKDRCDSLAQLSNKTLNDQVVMTDITAEAQLVCNEKIGLDKSIMDIEKMNTGLIEANVQQIMLVKCATCHTANTFSQMDYSVGGAPVIPFNNLSLLRYQINSPQGQLLGTADKIKERLNRPHDYPGAMPLKGIVDITQEDKAFVNVWLSQFTKQKKAAQPPAKTGL